MFIKSLSLRIILKCILSLFLSTPSFADEGMWPFDKVPTKQIEEKYHVQLDDIWLKHLQHSSLRVSLGGSASFISPKGLIITNHHVGSQAVHNLSSENQNFLQNGFYASSDEKELKCPNMYVDELIFIRDITAEVNSKLAIHLSSSNRAEEKKAILARIVEQAQKETGLLPEVVSLYQGAQHHLYFYKRYSDIRLVMAPEKSIAYFGGNEDNFEFPRYCLDICFFRAYEDNKPASTPSYLKWNSQGPKQNEVLFISGHPGRTDRMRTSAHLEFMKTEELSLLLDLIYDRINALSSFGKTSDENRRIAGHALFSYFNSQKVLSSVYKDLENMSIINNKKQFEMDFTKCNKELQEPWNQLKIALDNAKTYYAEYFILEGPGSRYSKLYTWAKNIVRSNDEKSKPNDQRLEEYTDSELPALELALFSEEPFYPSLDRVLLADSLSRLIKILGPNHPVVLIALNGKSIDARVEELFNETKLADIEYRKTLYNNKEQIENSQDPFILLAKALDPYSRKIREKKEDELDAIQSDSYEKIAALLFETYGESLYPDATFTLRLSIGKMKGYKQDGRDIPPETLIQGAYTLSKEYNNKEPYNLPQSWIIHENSIDKQTPFNFVSTNDIIGGNSGSPVVNANGEFVGIVFDGNRQSTLWDIEFTEEQGRAISVDSAAITAALKNIYQVHTLVDEIDHQERN
ncbi:MAG: S46 family peptidase [Chlamydiales bacterium]|nr:S46 family peptidase [Chlamydiales bacterium]